MQEVASVILIAGDYFMDELLEQLQSADRVAQLEALRQLEKDNRRDAIPAVLPLLESPDGGVRGSAALFLAKLAPLGDDVVGRRILAALSYIPDTSDFDELDNKLARVDITDALGVMLYTPAIPALQTMALANAEWMLRHSAILALEEMRSVESFGAFARAVETDESPVVQSLAAWAIYVVARPEHLAEIRRLVESQRDTPANLIRLLLAGYKLGVTDYFAQILHLLETIDDASEALNCLRALDHAYQGQQAPQAIADIPELMRALQVMANRFPDTEITFAEVIDGLDEAVSSDNDEEYDTAIASLDRRLAHPEIANLLDQLTRILAGEVIPPSAATHG